MNINKLCIALALWGMTLSGSLQAQEIIANVRMNTQKLQQADPKVFDVLASTITEFLNTERWTENTFSYDERIRVNIMVTLQEEISQTVFNADIAVQASRPVYGTDYETPLLNYIDKGVVFSYEPYQPLQFSVNRFNDNLSSALAFYIYMVLGMDYDSFEAFGGEPHFQMAQEIVNNVPESAAGASPGWRATSGNRSRFFFIENILSPRVRPFRQVWYEYHRQGLDVAATDINACRAIITAAMDQIRDVHQAYPNSMIMQVFSDTKSDEIMEIFKQGSPQEKNTVVQVMSRIDAANSTKFRSIK